MSNDRGNYPITSIISNSERDKQLIEFGITLGRHADITPEFVEITPERIDRLYQNWKINNRWIGA